MSGKSKTGMCNLPDIPPAAAPRIAIFTIKKVKTAKIVLDKKAPTTGTATPALQFLQAKKQK